MGNRDARSKHDCGCASNWDLDSVVSADTNKPMPITFQNGSLKVEKTYSFSDGHGIGECVAHTKLLKSDHRRCDARPVAETLVVEFRVDPSGRPVLDV